MIWNDRVALAHSGRVLSNQRQSACRAYQKESGEGCACLLRTAAAVATVKWPKTLKGASIIFSHSRRSSAAVRAPRLSRAARVRAFVYKKNTNK